MAAQAALAVEAENAERLAGAAGGCAVRRRSRVSTHPGGPRGRGGEAGLEIGIALAAPGRRLPKGTRGAIHISLVPESGWPHPILGTGEWAHPIPNLPLLS